MTVPLFTSTNSQLDGWYGGRRQPQPRFRWTTPYHAVVPERHPRLCLTGHSPRRYRILPTGRSVPPRVRLFLQFPTPACRWDYRVAGIPHLPHHSRTTTCPPHQFAVLALFFNGLDPGGPCRVDLPAARYPGGLLRFPRGWLGCYPPHTVAITYLP